MQVRHGRHDSLAGEIDAPGCCRNKDIRAPADGDEAGALHDKGGVLDDIAVAGDFLVMAATLIHIKSRMLLPRPDPSQEDPDEDPREALVRRLLEHQKFKAAAELLHERETLRSAQWTRPDGPIAEIAGEAPEPEIEVDLFSLITAFRTVVERSRQRPKVYLPGEQIPIEDRIEQLMAKLSETDACGFEDLFDDIATRSELPSAAVSSTLLQLELKRLVKQLPGKYFVKLS